MADGVPAIAVAKWDGTAWSSFGLGQRLAPNAAVKAIAVSGTSVYVGGDFYSVRTSPPASTNFIAKWDGQQWSSLGSGLDGNALALAIGPGSQVVVGGNFGAVADGSKLMSRVGIYADPQLAVISSISPGTGRVGTSLTITGTNLTGTTAVTFAGTATHVVTTGFTVNSAGTQVSGIVVPSGAASGPVTLTTPNGSTNALPFTLSSLTPTVAQKLLEVRMYPNPARSKLFVRVPAAAGVSYATLSLLDALGRTVRTQVLPLSASGTTAQVALTSLAPGLYKVQMLIGAQQVSQTLAVE
ncbi:IPT/TIG domain-containing protein [Hymenobacter sp. HSC-4F20]|uniref:T9SS type A sorting domain-containing protein n=1 Tax=Hymenobacter sp. HSC-4F20 TaxID=2864135 RepID=UPI001C72FCF2|nr:T9SS type A sorting domain-containing protein [Hymenobacter sp. HSC-4F20]MBX0292730.1 IPT/TIG domain-containing protein [Hymenobacter sp. HSC-4F20]